MKGHLWLNESQHAPHGNRWRFNMSRNAHKSLAVTVHCFLPTTYVVRGKVHLSFYSGRKGRGSVNLGPWTTWVEGRGRRNDPFLTSLPASHHPPPPFQLGLVQHDQQVWKENRAWGHGRYCLVMFMGGCLGKSFMTNQLSCDNRHRADDLQCGRLNLKEIGKCIECGCSDCWGSHWTFRKSNSAGHNAMDAELTGNRASEVLHGPAWCRKASNNVPIKHY